MIVLLKKRNFVISLTILILLCLVTIIGIQINKGYMFREEPEAVFQQASAQVILLDQPLRLEKPLYYISGRLYIPLADFLRAGGGKMDSKDEAFVIDWRGFSARIPEDGDTLIHKMYTIGGEVYLSLLDLTDLLPLSLVMKPEQSQILLYYKENKPIASNDSDNMEKAYLRLEDIGIDGIINNQAGLYLEKMRAVADLLYRNGQSFYIAWIPLYTDPARQIQNDLTRDFNLVNADFVYTLDYMRERGGHIVLHGLTHQENQTVSAVGTEFGPNTPFSEQEIEQRMLRAKEIADFFGYEDDIFEFPHNLATEQQLRLAEKHFNVIYQQSMRVKSFGNIAEMQRGLKRIFYVPTPQGFLQPPEKLNDFLGRIDQRKPGELISLFVHPSLDFHNIQVKTDQNGIRITEYSESGIIPSLIKKVTEQNAVFSQFDF